MLAGCLQISLHPDPPVLAANSATSIEVRYRPLLVGSSDAVLRLDSQELGSYEWKLRLKGAPTNPERSLAFSAPLGTRDTQVSPLGVVVSCKLQLCQVADRGFECVGQRSAAVG